MLDIVEVGVGGGGGGGRRAVRALCGGRREKQLALPMQAQGAVWMFKQQKKQEAPRLLETGHPPGMIGQLVATKKGQWPQGSDTPPPLTWLSRQN